MRFVKVGRAKDNDIVFNNDSTVSRYHMKMFYDDDDNVFVEDLNSANGTTINGKKITSPIKLKSLDVVKVGNSLVKWMDFSENIKQNDGKSKKQDLKETNQYEKPKKSTIKGILITIITIIILLAVFFLFISSIDSSIKNKAEDLYTNYIDPSIDKIRLQKKQKTDITYDFSCLSSNGYRENELITGLGDLKREIEGEFLSNVSVSINDEIKSGNQSYKYYTKEYTLIEYGSEVDKLNRILKNLVSRIANPRGFNYEIHYFKGKPFDNIVTSGGRIFVGEKFFKRFQSDSEIASIIGHEIAHNELKHLTSNLKKQKEADKWGVFGEIYNQIDNIFSSVDPFNQKQEAQADLFGVDLVQATNYNSCSSINFWQRLSKDEGSYNSIENLLKTHPYSSSRAKCIRNHLNRNYKIKCN